MPSASPLQPILILLGGALLVVILYYTSFYLLTLFFATLVIALSIAISVVMSQPFTGALVRLRANYLPKAVSLDNVLEDGAGAGASSGGLGMGGSGNDDGATTRKISAYFLSQKKQGAKIGPVLSGILPMLMRTKRLEGWSGVYKGSVPVACQLFLLAVVTSTLFDVDGHSTAGAGGGYKAAPTAPGQFGFFGNLAFMTFVAVISLPLNVLTYRAIVHPTVLPFGGPSQLRHALQSLLTPTELSRPWTLYLIPGLLPATFIHIGWVGLLTRALRHLLVPSLGGLADPTPASPDQTDYSGPNSSMKAVDPLALVVFLAWCLFSVVALSPMEVVTIRLATQGSGQMMQQQQQEQERASRGGGGGGGGATYSRLGTQPGQNAGGAGPASYSHQASVGRDGSPASAAGFKDRPPAAAADKPLPSEPNGDGSAAAPQSDAPAPSRPSFAIDEEAEDDVDDDDDDAATAKDPLTGASSKGQPNGTHHSSSRSHQPSPAPQQQPFSDSDNASQSPHRPYSSSSSGSSIEPPEPVIALRPVVDSPTTGPANDMAPPLDVMQPYAGFRDCLDKIVDEEGVEALYRGAWVTGLGALLGALT